MPKDEAALLKKGIVDPHGARLTYCATDCAGSSMGYPRYFDEVELYNNGLLSSKMGRSGHPPSPHSIE